jgi:hypothetical protein
LGGGIGHLRRKYGLSIDNLHSVELVTADGQFLTASKTENADLFWGVRGGGGNFGVVTSFEYILHPVGPTVALLLVMYPAEEAPQIIPAWRDFMMTAPAELSCNGMFTTVAPAPFIPVEIHGKPVFLLFGMYSGEVIEGERLIQPLRQLTRPLIDFSGPMPYTAVQSLFDARFPKGELLTYWKSTYLRHLDDAVINTISDWAATRPSAHTIIDLWAMGGAVNRIAANEATFGDQSSPYWLEMGGAENWVALPRQQPLATGVRPSGWCSTPPGPILRIRKKISSGRGPSMKRCSLTRPAVGISTSLASARIKTGS